KARLRFVFYKLGKEEVFRLFHEIYKEVKKIPGLAYKHVLHSFPAPEYTISQDKINSKEYDKWKTRYVTAQRQTGLNSVIVPFNNGNVDPATLIQIAQFAQLFGEDVIRFSMRQNLHLRNIPDQYLGNVYNFINRLGIDIQTPLLLSTIVSCTGADTCRLGICLSKGAADALKKSLLKSNLELDKISGLKINISGCPNSCGQQVAADLGFYGKVGRNDRLYPAYHIVAGASSGESPKLAEKVGEISARDLPDFTVALINSYLSKHDQYTSFAEYIASEGRKEIATLTATYNNQIPDFADDKNYYFDWGAEAIFSLVNKGAAECSAGLFDMIEVDLNAIEAGFKNLEPESDKNKINETLRQIIFSSARMLLITRGAEPRNSNETYDLFLNRFIDAGLVSAAFREIIEVARDNSDYDFSASKQTILDLANSVMRLYEGMDDSLQFKLEHIAEPEEPGKAQHKLIKDFRNVACPMNFVKTKIALSTLHTDDILEIWIDDGEPIENVPGSIKSEGHKILEQKKVDDYWSVTIQKV
ncbi:MAG TPA: sulfurtransferase TusA family protein, partial [Bacteroidales bacterium]|nr:sulfurtransferase TusA family protein [Bacteroidales bacterium]